MLMLSRSNFGPLVAGGDGNGGKMYTAKIVGRNCGKLKRFVEGNGTNYQVKDKLWILPLFPFIWTILY